MRHGNEGKRDTMTTHEDWLKAKDYRDNRAMLAVRALAAGQLGAAELYAAEALVHDSDMARMEAELAEADAATDDELDAAAAEAAKVMAQATGSVGATYTVERRDRDGNLVQVSTGTWGTV